jgi:16S rRNA (uracil1498-N3)-methyltransferase
VPPRFYVPEAEREESAIELPQDEAAHLTRVLRLRPGARVRVFNGRGSEWEAEVEDVSRQRVSLRLGARVSSQREPRIPITLAVAVLKGEKMDDIVRDAVMLGVTRLRPLITKRTEITTAAVEKSSRVGRWQRIAVASAKQCGRAVVPEVCAVAPFEQEITTAPVALMLIEPSAATATMTLPELPAVDQLTLFVGPEGGWTAQEVETARASGAMLMTLGALTLRADAVPMVALTAVRVRLEDF